jgi:hypothetical protein
VSAKELLKSSVLVSLFLGICNTAAAAPGKTGSELQKECADSRREIVSNCVQYTRGAIDGYIVTFRSKKDDQLASDCAKRIAEMDEQTAVTETLKYALAMIQAKEKTVADFLQAEPAALAINAALLGGICSRQPSPKP